MNASKYMSNFLNAESVKELVEVTIQSVSEEEVGSQKDKKLAIYFKEMEQGLIPAKAVLKFLVGELGDETDAWVGKKFVLFSDPNVFFQGKRVGGLRLKKVEGK